MLTYQVEVQVTTDLPEPLTVRWLKDVVQRTLEHEHQPAHSGLTLVITDDATIQQLNSTYRGIDAPTDVLSFATADSPDDFVTPAELPPYLGDVIVSLPTALVQAAEHGQPTEQEVALLIVHGCLHLLGYDHGEDDERQRMWALQDEILARLKQAGKSAS